MKFSAQIEKHMFAKLEGAGAFFWGGGVLAAGTHWAEWWHKAGWPPGLLCWVPPSLSAPRCCTASCCPHGRRCTLWWLACWCCSAWGTLHQRWPRAHGRCSSADCCSCSSVSGFQPCCLETTAYPVTMHRSITCMNISIKSTRNYIWSVNVLFSAVRWKTTEYQ